MSNAFKFVAACLLSVLGFLMDLAFPLGVAGGLFQIPALAVVLTYESKISTLTIAGLATVFTVLGYLYSPGVGISTNIILTNRISALVAIFTIVFLGMSHYRAWKIVAIERNKYLEAHRDVLEILRRSNGADAKVRRISSKLEVLSESLNKSLAKKENTIEKN